MDPDSIAAAFGLGAGARLSDGAVARGRQGEVWRLETAEGPFAVKVPFERVEEGDVAGAAAFHEAAHAAGVPTPAIRRSGSGEVLADVDGHRLRVYDWVDVLPPDLALDPVEVGRMVARLHLVPDPASDHGPVPEWYAEPVGVRRWDALVDEVRSRQEPFAPVLAALRDELVALDAWVAPHPRPRTCHRDLWADNVRATPDGGVCVLDWENSGPADPAYELACVLFEFGRGEAGRVRTLVDSYVEAGGPARLTDHHDFSMLIAQLGHITEHAARAGEAEWVGELVDDPHTRQVLGSLLSEVVVR
jgi:Ser/Thr protein kinase RdoA (MazF antagonist)